MIEQPSFCPECGEKRREKEFQCSLCGFKYENNIASSSWTPLYLFFILSGGVSLFVFASRNEMNLRLVKVLLIIGVILFIVHLLEERSKNPPPSSRTPKNKLNEDQEAVEKRSWR